MIEQDFSNSEADEEVLAHLAVVSMSCRFPDAPNVDTFWQNLENGVESIVPFSDEQLREAGVSEEMINHPNYVKVGTMLDNIADFDAHFFGFTPREAEITDPQQRILLEICHETLELAGYDPNRYNGQIGVFCGVAMSNYLVNNLMANKQIFEEFGPLPVMFGNGSAYHATKVSYKLNLTGPSMNVDTACSTSLVALHQACKSLLAYECDMALAGGVHIKVPQQQGYLYQQGGIRSPDGHVRAFDARGEGIVSGNGAGVVLLKRLEDALADRDQIHAVVLATAINNDGSDKVGYSAPSVRGQANAIADAHGLAEVDPETITYQEAHGTGTVLGDPIELAALKEAFSLQTEKRGFCALGSLKTNVGHMDVAAGIGGFIKTALCIEKGMLVPSLNFETPNPDLHLEPAPDHLPVGEHHGDFDESTPSGASQGSPFFVSDRTRKWETGDMPRRAGVSSFGMGGTNAHAVLEQAPQPLPSGPSRKHQLLLLSAKCAPALDAATARLADHLRGEENLADAAYTLKLGRGNYAHRRFALASSCAEAAEKLTQLGSLPMAQLGDGAERSVVFMFPGQGSQYVNMGRGLYEEEPIFKQHLDEALGALRPHVDRDLRGLLFPQGDADEADALLAQCQYTQPALFAVQYALGKLLIYWGINPQAMIGHSVGEITAATLAEVFTLEEAARLVAKRGALMASCPTGAMLAARLSEAAVSDYLNGGISLAAVNAPDAVAVSGNKEAIEALAARWDADGVGYRRLKTSHAFHDPSMDGILASFRAELESLAPKPPQIPVMGCATGAPLSAAEITDPDYWVRQLRHTVKFSAGMQQLLKQHQVFLEVGPGQVLTNLARAHEGATAVSLITCMRQKRDHDHDQEHLLNALGRLWLSGVMPDWETFYEEQTRNRVALPTYAFQRKTYWIDPPQGETATLQFTGKKANRGDWFYVPSWKTALPFIHEPDLEPGTWLVFADEDGVADELGIRLGQDHDLVVVKRGAHFSFDGDRTFEIDPDQGGDYEQLLNHLAEEGRLPQRLVHLWHLGEVCGKPLSAEQLRLGQTLGYDCLVYLCQALSALGVTETMQLAVVGNGLQTVFGHDPCHPQKATVLGPLAVIPQEFSNIRCIHMDMGSARGGGIVSAILDEFAQDLPDHLVAFRGGSRFVRAYEPLQLEASEARPTRLREGATYAIIGGLGDIGRKLSNYLYDTVGARILVIARTPLPPEDSWDALLDQEPDSRQSRRIRHLRELRAKGAQILVAAADVASEEALQEAFAHGEQALGPIRGVFHAASASGQSIGLIGSLTSEDTQRQFRPKVEGLTALASVLEGRELDFTLLFSSLASILGGIGYTAYASANLFMDAFVRANKFSSANWQAINWDAWNFPSEDGEARLGASLVDFAIDPDEGMDALGRLLNARNIHRLVNSTGDLQARLNQWITLSDQGQDQLGATHERPNLSTPYTPPGDDIQEMLVEMWQNLFGMERVGIHDDFFELGGNSLMGTQVTSRIRDLFGVGLPMQTLFDAPTIAQIAGEIESTTVAATDDETLADLLAEIEDISDEEAASLL